MKLALTIFHGVTARQASVTASLVLQAEHVIAAAYNTLTSLETAVTVSTC